LQLLAFLVEIVAIRNGDVGKKKVDEAGCLVYSTGHLRSESGRSENALKPV